MNITYRNNCDGLRWIEREDLKPGIFFFSKFIDIQGYVKYDTTLYVVIRGRLCSLNPYYDFRCDGIPLTSKSGNIRKAYAKDVTAKYLHRLPKDIQIELMEERKNNMACSSSS